MKGQTNYKLLFFLLMLTMAQMGNAQVTIGSEHSPAKAALLQIKDTEPDLATISPINNVTAVRGGMVFPRINLVNINTLEPILSSPQNDEKQLLTGLVVYNLSAKLDPNGKVLKKGLYLWDGIKWNEMVFLN